MKKYWFTLKPDTFLWRKLGKGLVYNAANGKQFRFELTDEISSLFQILQTYESL